MKLFLDTSTLFKLYHQETGSEFVDSLFSNFPVKEVFLSEITKVEFASTAWKKFRVREITEEQVMGMLASFENDLKKYTFLQIDNMVIEHAKQLFAKYGSQGLRALDSIQFSTALLLNTYADLFVTSDKLLEIFFKQEGLPTENPQSL